MTKEVLDWLDDMRNSIRERIESYNKLPESARKKYADVSEYFDWPIEDQQMWGHLGAIECDVNYTWDELKPKTKKELGSKAEAANLVAIILRDEFDIDIVNQVKYNGQPHFLIHDQINEYDWQTDEEYGYKKLSKFIASRNLDKGSALRLYWEACPEFFTQYESLTEIKWDHEKTLFRLLKKLEKRLLENKFKTNDILYIPSPESIKSESAKWDIPDILLEPNLKI